MVKLFGQPAANPNRALAVRLALAVLAVFIAGNVTGCSSAKVRFGYVATGQGIFAFRLDAKTGAATQVFGSPFVVRTNSQFGFASASSVLVHPSNQFLYVANQNVNSISEFKIDQTTGELTEVQPRTALTSSGGVGLAPAVMTMDSAGKFLFVGNQGSNDIWVFSIADSGGLTFVSSATVGASPTGLTLSASGNFLYVPVQAFSAIEVFNVSAGSLTQMTPIVVSGGVGQVGIDPQGGFLYVPNPSTDTVTVLRIQADGTLTLGPGAFATGTTPVAAIASQTGAYVYVANSGSTNVSQFQVDTTNGQLAPLTGTTAGTGSQPVAIIADPQAKFTFVVNQSANSVSEFTSNSNGTLSTSGNTVQLNVPPRWFSITN
jgi:6-phosphogluconolactonase (cycloisomerase 2 family)